MFFPIDHIPNRVYCIHFTATTTILLVIHQLFDIFIAIITIYSNLLFLIYFHVCIFVWVFPLFSKEKNLIRWLLCRWCCQLIVIVCYCFLTDKFLFVVFVVYSTMPMLLYGGIRPCHSQWWYIILLTLPSNIVRPLISHFLQFNNVMAGDKRCGKYLHIIFWLLNSLLIDYFIQLGAFLMSFKFFVLRIRSNFVVVIGVDTEVPWYQIFLFFLWMKIVNGLIVTSASIMTNYPTFIVQAWGHRHCSILIERFAVYIWGLRNAFLLRNWLYTVVVFVVAASHELYIIAVVLFQSRLIYLTLAVEVS